MLGSGCDGSAPYSKILKLKILGNVVTDINNVCEYDDGDSDTDDSDDDYSDIC